MARTSYVLVLLQRRLDSQSILIHAHRTLYVRLLHLITTDSFAQFQIAVAQRICRSLAEPTSVHRLSADHPRKQACNDTCLYTLHAQRHGTERRIRRTTSSPQTRHCRSRLMAHQVSARKSIACILRPTNRTIRYAELAASLNTLRAATRARMMSMSAR